MEMHPVVSLTIVTLFVLEFYIPMVISIRYLELKSLETAALERSEQNAGGTVSAAPPASPRVLGVRRALG